MMLQQGLSEQLQANLKSTELSALGLHLALALVMGHVLGWHYTRFASVLSNRQKLARVLVFVCATTLLIISVVKSSLALSLGLVGALSIIRFRTPIKEPEELAYLFLAVAIGVGLGAERPIETALVFVVVLVAMAARARTSSGRMRLRTVLQVQAPALEGGRERGLAELMPAVTPHCERVDLRRVDLVANEFHASLVVDLGSTERLQALIAGVRAALPGASVSVIERDSLD